jgi:phage gp37-like protein
MSYTITEIEDAIIETLKTSVMGGYCKKIDSYQIEGGDIEDQIRIFAGHLPCALVVYFSGDFAHHPNKQQDKEMVFSILVCAQSMRGGGESRRGSIGAYKMLDDLRSILTGQRVGLTIDPLIPVSEKSEVNTKMFSAYSMDFRTKCRFTF